MKKKVTKEKVTKVSLSYPEGEKPEYIIPEKYCEYRFSLGRKGTNPLVAICMNPSAARETSSDMTINRIIGVSRKLEMDGWMVFNIYPERATDASDMNSFDEKLSEKNIRIIREFLILNNIKEVWGAWGNDQGLIALKNGKKKLLEMLDEIGVKIFYFGTLSKENNPKHPLQRQEKWNIAEERKKYL